MYFPTLLDKPQNTHPLAPGGLIDQLFNASFPWKMLKTFSDQAEQDELQLVPKVDVLSNQNSYIVNVEIPGVKADDVKVEVKDGALVISGEKQAEKTTDTGHTKHVTERSWGSFYRAFSLPEDADIEQITAAHKDGVLSINIQKKATEKAAKTISITRG